MDKVQVTNHSKVPAKVDLRNVLRPLKFPQLVQHGGSCMSGQCRTRSKHIFNTFDQFTNPLALVDNTSARKMTSLKLQIYSFNFSFPMRPVRTYCYFLLLFKFCGLPW
jgi:hypothetical protein